MGFGKRMAEFAAIVAGLALAAALTWYALGSLTEHEYEKEGTLVQAFLMDPEVRVYGESEFQRSGKGL